jgi:hypothetical protein
VCDEGVACDQVLPREAATEDVNGRGLQLVGAVAEKWGVRPGGEDYGRVVWAELSLTASPAIEGGLPAPCDSASGVVVGQRRSASLPSSALDPKPHDPAR